MEFNDKRIISADEVAKNAVQYSVVIPAYCSADSLPVLHMRLSKMFEEINGSFEIIVVDDASPDSTWEVLKKLHEKDKRVKILQHARNFGQHKALLCAIQHARGEYVITIDDDLQHPPEEIPKLITAIKKDKILVVVIGAYQTKQHNVFRNFGTNVINALVSYIFVKDKNLKMTSFRIMRKAVAKEIVKFKYHNPRIGHLLLLTTNRIINIEVEHHKRKHGKSGYTFRKLISDTLDNILSNSSLPLQIVSFLGFGCSLLSIFLSIFYLYKYFSGGIGVPGWTTVILLLLFFFGILLFSFGAVGEYLIRILKEVQGSPHSVVRQKEL